MLLLLGCAGVSFPGGSGFPAGRGTPPAPPEVRVAASRMVEAPTNRELAGWFCAEHAPPLICRVFGPVPNNVRFVFDVELEIENRNAIPLPVASALFAFTAFPEATTLSGESATENLGSACVSFCEDPEHCEPDANACTSDEPEIRDAEDFANAALGFLIDVARGERRFQDLRVRTVAAQDRLRLVVRLEIAADQLTRLIRSVLRETINRVMRGEDVRFEIPYRLEGSVWVAVENFGRFAASFGPHDAVFSL